MSRVSAIIATYNARATLGAAIDSALGQTAPLLELIVVDDGSTDGTWSDLERLAARARRDAGAGPRIRIERQANAGPSAARNAGLRLATGDYVAFLDSDDAWHPDKTARQLAVFDADAGLALVGCAASTLRVFPGRKLVPIGVDELLFRNYLLTPGVIARRDALVAAGGFAEDMRHCEDFDLWLRIASRHRCALLNEELMTCGAGKPPFGHSGLSAGLRAMHAGEREAYRRWHAAGGPLLKYWKALVLSWLRFARRLAIVAAQRAR